MSFLTAAVEMEDEEITKAAKELCKDVPDHDYTDDCRRMDETTFLRQIYRNIPGYGFYVRVDMPQFGLSNDEYVIFQKRVAQSVLFEETCDEDAYLLEILSKPIKISIYQKIQIFFRRRTNYYQRW